MEDHQIWWEWVLQSREQNRSRAQNWATRPGQTQTIGEDDKLVTSDLEKAALISRQVNRMEEVVPDISKRQSKPCHQTYPNQALSGLWYNRRFPKQQARLIHTLQSLL